MLISSHLRWKTQLRPPMNSTSVTTIFLMEYPVQPGVPPCHPVLPPVESERDPVNGEDPSFSSCLSRSGPANLVRDASGWLLEHEWQQDIAVVTKWLWSHQGSVQLHWSQWPPNQSTAAPKGFQMSKGLLGAGPSGIMAADAIITDSGAMLVVPIVNPSTVVVWEVTPGLGSGFQVTPKITTTKQRVPPSKSPPNWAGFSPLAAYLFSWQDYLISESKQGRKQTDSDSNDTVSLHCSLVSNFSTYVSLEAAAQIYASCLCFVGLLAFYLIQGTKHFTEGS